ncbi:MAG: epoxide hydrolase N-terminal domain-containing protein, partial [Chloroflexi bacterium]|nr:epoxide hydrolase N-terminal domain-containing protein [Chloroflexota bacterium]
MTIRPFTIETPDSALADLKRRLERTRWPDQIPGSRWDYGADSAYMRELAGYWQACVAWRRQERMLNEF